MGLIILTLNAARCTFDED